MHLPACARRQVADAAYAVVVRAAFAQLERIAGPDAKHGQRLRLENYALLASELAPLAARVTSSAGSSFRPSMPPAFRELTPGQRQPRHQPWAHLRVAALSAP